MKWIEFSLFQVMVKTTQGIFPPTEDRNLANTTRKRKQKFLAIDLFDEIL